MYIVYFNQGLTLDNATTKSGVTPEDEASRRIYSQNLPVPSMRLPCALAFPP